MYPNRISLSALVLGALSVLSLGAAAAERTGPATPAGSAEATALLEAIEASKDERGAKIDALMALEPTPVKEIEAFLARERKSSETERRAVLEAIDADVPDAKGKFRTPKRQTKNVEKDNDKFDWMAGLMTLSARPGLGEVIADVAAIRALAASTNPDAGTVILAFAFTEVGLVFRDECGRYLRRMSPYSLPALIAGSQERRSRRRYATYQLERLDRQNPHKALNDAPTDALKVKILETFAESQYREAVYAVLRTIDDDAPPVRAAARRAWMEYATGRRPPKVPKRKLVMAGGKLSDEEEPLWLNHRELADIAIRRLYKDLVGEKPARGSTLAELSKQVFEIYDERRAKELDSALDAAKADADAGKLEAAAATLDQILVQNPDFHGRPAMAEIYLRRGKELEAQKEWALASSTYAKAHAIDPKGSVAEEALSAHHFTRGKLRESDGKDAKEDFARAREVMPEGGAGADGGDRSWMLFVGVGGGVLGLLLIGFGIAMRRRR